MKQRIISSLIMLPLLVFLYVGGGPLYCIGLVVMAIGLHEFYTAFNNIGHSPIKELGYLYAIMIFLINIFSWNKESYAVGMYLTFVIGIVYVLLHRADVMDLIITFSGIFYVCLCFNYIIRLFDMGEKGYLYVWLIFIISFATDIFAYFVGRRFGSHKLIPSVSPKKTIEGSMGGVVASVVFSVLFGLIFKLQIGPIFLVGLLGSAVAQMGDLIASSIKRYVGIKDFGRLIPGHGGILDRFDSVLLVAPYVYLILSLFAV